MTKKPKFGGVLLIACFPAVMLLTQVRGETGLQQNVISSKKHADIVQTSKTELENALRTVGPSKKGKVAATLLDDQRYVLHGDLFKNGHSYALVEVKEQTGYTPYPGAAFLIWKGGRWKLKTLWAVHPEWRPKGWKAGEGESFPLRPATEPFRLQDFDGDHIPEVVMVGEVWRYWQEYYVLHFNAKTEELDLVAESMGEPKLIDGYTRLYRNSGHRSIFEEWDFGRWSKGHLFSLGSLHDETPYNNVDPSFLEFTRFDGKGRELFRLKVVMEDPVSNQRWSYSVTDASGHTARLRIRWHRPTAEWGWGERSVSRYLFAKITQLPVALHPEERDVREKKRGGLNRYATITVTGDKSLVKLFR